MVAKLIEWYRKAAQQGNTEAQNFLGRCYYNGTGVTQNYSEAAKWCRKAAQQGNVEAQNTLGNCHYVMQDYHEVVKWYRTAAEQGHAYAQYSLGICYYNGFGVEQNYEEARKWYGKAAEQGNAEAQQALNALDNPPDSAENEDQSLSKYWIDPDLCDGCGCCVGECPSNAIMEEDDGVCYIDSNACTNCGACMDACPNEAILEPEDDGQYQSDDNDEVDEEDDDYQDYVPPNRNRNQRSALGEVWQNTKKAATPVIGKTLGDIAGSVLRGIFGG